MLRCFPACCGSGCFSTCCGAPAASAGPRPLPDGVQARRRRGAACVIAAPLKLRGVQKTFIDDFPLPLAATCRTREAPEEVLLAILGGHSPLEGHVILEHDALVVYQRHGHGDQSLQRCEYHHARAGASGPSRAIVAFGGNLLAATIKLLRGRLRSTTAERDLLQLTS